MAAKTMQDVIDAGQLTFDVIKGIRAAFLKEADSLSEFSLGELVRETTSLLAKEFAARKISLDLALDDEQPPITANRVQIQRVLVNLLTNSTDAGATTEQPGRRIVIRAAALDDENALVEITDSGARMAPDQIEQLFDPLFTAKSAPNGFGLSLSRSIVDEHGGQLWASQDEESGTTFHMTLPKRAGPALPV